MQSSRDDLEASARPCSRFAPLTLSLRLHQAQKSTERPLVLEWENINFSVKNKQILHDVSGRVESGEMLASGLLDSLKPDITDDVGPSQLWAPRVLASPPSSM